MVQIQTTLENKQAMLAGSSQQAEELKAKCANYMENIQAMEEQVSKLGRAVVKL